MPAVKTSSKSAYEIWQRQQKDYRLVLIVTLIILSYKQMIDEFVYLQF